MTQRWEHYVERIGVEGSVVTLAQWLAGAGQQGWELVGLTPAETTTTETGTVTTTVIAYLKRPIPG